MLIYLLGWARNAGYECGLILHKDTGEYQELIPAGTKVRIVPPLRVGLLAFSRRNPLRSAVKELNPDVCISFMTPANLSIMRVFAFSKTNRPYIILNVQNNISFNFRAFSSTIKRPLKRLELKILYSRADSIVAASEGIGKDLINSWEISGDIITTICNPVDCAKVNTRANEFVHFPWKQDLSFKVIVAVGRLVSQKGYHDMIETFEKVRMEESCKLLILGQGPLHEELQVLVDKFGLKDDVYFLGFVENPWSYLVRADLYLSTSHWEGLPLTLLEVMALGIPCVCTDCDFGPREVISSGVDGVLAPVGDIDAISERVLSLLRASDSKLELMSNNARLKAQQYDVKRYIDSYKEML